MLNMEVGDKLICLFDIENFFGQPLFELDKSYVVLDISDDGKISLNHNLYANEYSYFDVDWISQNFKKIN